MTHRRRAHISSADAPAAISLRLINSLYVFLIVTPHAQLYKKMASSTSMLFQEILNV
jgi:hypothetical protein